MRMRKKKRGHERLEALSALVITEPEIYKENGDFPFFEKLPLRLEIGCGKGDFICQLSKRDTEYNYLAMERVEDVCVAATEKYARGRGLGDLDHHGGWKTPDGEIYKGEAWDIPMEMRGNVRFMPLDASKLEEYFAPETFESIYANFSDPWTKNGYSSRRLTHPDFLARYLKLLKPGGYFRFKTDNDELFEFSVESVEASELELLYVTRDLHASDRADTNIVTEYEANFSSKGVPIKFLEARKK